MAVGLKELPKLYPVKGIKVGVASAGIKTPGRLDLTIFELEAGCHCVGVFTRNSFCAAPVTLAKSSLAKMTPHYLLVNTGNANAGTGRQGFSDAQHCCHELAQLSNCDDSEVLPFSTGVIGEPLPVEKIVKALPVAMQNLRDQGWADAAHAIMTTDTVAKASSKQIMIGDNTVTITGIAKGSGMIRPDMATMLAFVATDANIDKPLLQTCLSESVNNSFNRITVDGDTSTNDACMLIASGKSGVNITDTDESLTLFQQGLNEIMLELAQAIIRDGEGATKFITIQVEGGADSDECLQVGYTVAHSPLVKTAFFASDPNWGRILAAVGRSGIENLDIDRLEIYLDDVCIVKNGGRDSDYTEAKGQVIMEQEEISIRIILHRGHAQEIVWTSDLSHEYVRINAEYRS